MIFEVKFDNYLKYEPLLKITGDDISSYKSTYNGSQVVISDKNDPLYFEYRDEVRAIVDGIIANYNPELAVVETITSWVVNYRKDGHQIPHRHRSPTGHDIWSAVLYFNRSSTPMFFAEYEGVDYELLDSPGTLRVFNSTLIPHYTKLAPRPRSVIVQDFLVTPDRKLEK